MDNIVAKMLSVYTESAATCIDASDALVPMTVPSIMATDKNKHFWLKTHLYPQHCPDLYISFITTILITIMELCSMFTHCSCLEATICSNDIQ